MSGLQINHPQLNQNQKFHPRFADSKVFELKKVLFRLDLQFASNEQQFLSHQALTKYHSHRILKQ